MELLSLEKAALSSALRSCASREGSATSLTSSRAALTCVLVALRSILAKMSSGGIRSKRMGEHGEQAAYLALRSIGLEFIEPIHQAWKLIRWLPKYGRGAAHIVPLKKLKGDFRAIGRDGVSVLVEVKMRDEQLLWSDLKQHQREALTEHYQCGGMSLVVWVATNDIFVLEWPIDGFAPRRSLSEEQARALNLTSI